MLTKLTEKLKISNLETGNQVDISSSTTKIDFMKNMSPAKIIEAYEQVKMENRESRGWGPIAWDKKFFKIPAIEYLYNTDRIEHVPYLIGTTSYDGSRTAFLNAPFTHKNFRQKVFGLIRLTNQNSKC